MSPSFQWCTLKSLDSNAENRFKFVGKILVKIYCKSLKFDDKWSNRSQFWLYTCTLKVTAAMNKFNFEEIVKLVCKLLKSNKRQTNSAVFFVYSMFPGTVHCKLFIKRMEGGSTAALINRQEVWSNGSDLADVVKIFVALWMLSFWLDLIWLHLPLNIGTPYTVLTDTKNTSFIAAVSIL